MSDLEIELTAPNGVKYKQPTGLFINNEWVRAKKGEKITSINPTYVTCVTVSLSSEVLVTVQLSIPRCSLLSITQIGPSNISRAPQYFQII